MNTDIHVLATVQVGSHLETYERVASFFEDRKINFTLTLVDIVEWTKWNATDTPYHGEAKRYALRPTDWDVHQDSPMLNEKIVQHAEQFLSSHKPSIVLTISDKSIPDLALIRAAHRLQVPSLLIQEGPRRDMLPSVRDALPFSALLEPLKGAWRRINWRLGTGRYRFPLYGGGGGDRIAVASSFYRDLFRKGGIAENKLEVTGIPRFDNLVGLREKGVPSNDRSPRVLIASQPFARYGVLSHSEQDSLQKGLADAVNQLATSVSLDLSLRLHPSEDLSDVAVMRESLDVSFQIDEAEGYPYEVLPKYDLLIGYCSTIQLEAVAAGVPSVRWGSKEIDCFFDETVSLPVARTSSEFVEECKKVLRDPEAACNVEGLERETGRLDGKSAERVADLITDLAVN